MSGHHHCPTAATQNCGNTLGSRPSVRISDYYLRDTSGSALKSIIEANEAAAAAPGRTRAQSVGSADCWLEESRAFRHVNLFPSADRTFAAVDDYAYPTACTPTKALSSSQQAAWTTPEKVFDDYSQNSRSAPAACWGGDTSYSDPRKECENQYTGTYEPLTAGWAEQCRTPPRIAHNSQRARANSACETPTTPSPERQKARGTPQTGPRPACSSRAQALRQKKSEYYDGSHARDILYCQQDDPDDYLCNLEAIEYQDQFFRPSTAAELLLENNLQKSQSGGYTASEFFEDVKNAQLGMDVVPQSRALNAGLFQDLDGNIRENWRNPRTMPKVQRNRQRNLGGNGDIISWASPG